MVKRKRFVSLVLLLILLDTLFVTPVRATKEEDGTAPTQSTKSTEPPGETTLENAFGEPSDFMTKDLLFDKESNKQFITVQDRKGNIFYIIIDYDAPVDDSQEQYKTYFLNPVDLEDLQGLTDNKEAFPTTCTCTDKCGPGQVNMSCSLCAANMTECAGQEAPASTVPTTTPLAQGGGETAPSAGVSSIAPLVILVMVIGGVLEYAVFRKIKAAKPQKEDPDDFIYEEEEEQETGDEEAEEE